MIHNCEFRYYVQSAWREVASEVERPTWLVLSLSSLFFFVRTTRRAHPYVCICICGDPNRVCGVKSRGFASTRTKSYHM